MNEKEKLRERLKAALTRRGVRPPVLAAAICGLALDAKWGSRGVTDQWVRQWLMERGPLPNVLHLKMAAQALQVRELWLLSGEGMMVTDDQRRGTQ